MVITFLFSVLAYEVFAFGFIGANLGPDSILITLFLLPFIMALLKKLIFYMSITFALRNKEYSAWNSDLNPLLPSLTFTVVRRKHTYPSIQENQPNNETFDSLLAHVMLDFFSLIENIAFVTFGAVYIMDANFNKTIFCSIVLGTHLIGIIVKCSYYKYFHPWMSLSVNQQALGKYFDGIIGILGLTVFGIVIYVSILKKYTGIVVACGFLVSLVRNIKIQTLG